MTSRVRFRAFLVCGFLLAASLAFFLAPRASGEPDGLERVAIDQGIAANERAHPLAGSPTADYAVRGIGDDALATGVAGLVGVVATFAVAGGLLVLVRRAR